MIRVKWDIEEMVALCDLYLKNKKSLVLDMNSELLKLSTILNKRADMLGIEHDDKFRNLSGLKMIMENIRFVDEQGKDGLANTSNMACYIVYMSRVDKQRFYEILKDFYRKYGE